MTSSSIPSDSAYAEISLWTVPLVTAVIVDAFVGCFRSRFFERGLCVFREAVE